MCLPLVIILVFNVGSDCEGDYIITELSKAPKSLEEI